MILGSRECEKNSIFFSRDPREGLRVRESRGLLDCRVENLGSREFPEVIEQHCLARQIESEAKHSDENSNKNMERSPSVTNVLSN